MEEIWQEHTYIIDRAPGVGYGMAISGGRDNPGLHTGDTSIIVSDVIRSGPAFDKLQVNDIILRVNGKPMYNMEHSKAIKELKNSGQRVELMVRRKIVVQPSTPPSRMRRSRSRDLDSLHRRRSRSPDDRGRYRSRSRDDRYRRHRSRSRDIDSDRYRDHSYRRSISRSPPRRGRSYSRSPSRSRYRSRSRDSSRSYRRRTRSRSPSYRRDRARSRSSRRSSFTASSRSTSPPPRLEKHKSVEDLRRATSPLEPDVHDATPDGEMLVFPVKKREPKTVVLKKTRFNNSYGLKLGTRIYIQDIQPNSLADKSSDVSAGDTVLMINGRNVDNKSVQEAIQIIGLSKDKVTMLVKKEDGGTVTLPASRFTEPSRDRRESESEERTESSRRSSFSKDSDTVEEPPVAASLPEVAPKPEKKQYGGIRVLPTGNSSLPQRTSSSSSSGSSHPSPEPAPRSNIPLEREYSIPPGDDQDEEIVLPPTARQITFVKGKNVGIRLTGGNDVGIFVASVQDGSPAARQGLEMGDQILSVNDVNFRNVIREEAVLTLMGLPAGEDVSIIAQPQPEVYKRIIERGTGDSFYVRTHFKYDKNGQHEMSFKRGSTFRISDTLYQGMVGYWLAVRIGRNNMEVERGVIPNSSRAEQLKIVQDKKITQMKDHRNRGIGRRFKNQKSEAPKSSSSSAMYPAYERVVLREAGFKRPVVVFGPLADIARERLAGDYPNSYEIARNEGMVSGQKANRKGVIRLNTIKDLIEKDKHAILDITPNAVEKLNHAQLYPIVVYLEAQSKSAVKELRAKLATTEEEKKKKAGKLFDRAHKLQRGYNHVFTDSIKLNAASDDWYRKLHSTIRDQQSMPVWVSEDKLGGSPTDGDEGVTIPGDDDQLSYVSAPASDYSVTTVGSDMLNNSSRMSEDEDEEPRNDPRPKPPSTSSSEEGEKFDDDDFDDVVDAPVAPATEKPHSPPTTREAEENPVVVEDKPSLPYQPRPVSSSSSSDSSSSSEDEPPIPTITPAPPTGRATTKADSPRSRPNIPEGRFDPQSFLKSHIGGLKKKPTHERISPPRSSPSPPPVARQPSREEPKVPVAKTTPSYAAKPVVNGFQADPIPSRDSTASLSLLTAQPFKRAEPQQPVYAQVNKNKPVTPAETPDDRRESTTRNYAREIDSFISAGPYKKPFGADRRPSRDELLTRHVSPPQPKPSSNPYNRFAGSQAKLEPKPYQPYNASKPSYQRPSATAQTQPKSKFVQEQYKEYMSQIRPSQSSAPYTAPKPFNKAPPKQDNGVGSKENLYDSGVDTRDGGRFKKDPVPASPSSIDDDDPQVVATARGFFDSNGGVLSSVETGVSIVIPKGAIRPGSKQEIYFKVCRDNTALPPLDKNKGETLLSPLVMCGPHGLQFEHPVELRLPHCASMTSDGWSFALKTSNPGEPSEWHNVGKPNESNNYDVGSNSVSVLIDHF